MHIRICPDDFDDPQVIALLEAHLEDGLGRSPPESVHTLGMEELRSRDITFWTLWQDTVLFGCGALKEIDSCHGEVKSMHTAIPHRGKGVAAEVLEHIINEARLRPYQRLSLETGASDAYKPARQLYMRFGFVPCEPFANYAEDPNSLFMTLAL